jgi:Cof subfamily protein (haloacid dehalogenase superfamily)
MDISSYKAFLFDVDKTLTNLKKEITPRTQTTLQLLAQKKYTIGICTGRHFATVRGVLADYFPKESLHVLAGGGLVMKADGEVLYKNTIPDITVRKIASIANAHDARLVVQEGSQLYGNEKAQKFQSRYALASSQQKMMEDVTVLQDWSVPLVVVGGITDDMLSELSQLPVSYKAMISYSGERYTDITAEGVTKASGVLQWCTMQGIKPEEVIGFGDSENDVEFLKTVGYAVAVGNATDEVKAIADEVTADCDHDGVAEWIQKNVKG